jgi:hypothetical protein
MATINWLRANLRGKLGEIVGSSWRGRPYVKIYSKPSNPRTPEQMGVRNTFREVTKVAKGIYHQALKPYTLPRPKGMTAYNYMIHINRNMIKDRKWEPSRLKIFDGPLYNRGFHNFGNFKSQVVIVKKSGQEYFDHFLAFPKPDAVENTNSRNDDIRIIVAYDDKHKRALCHVGTRDGSDLCYIDAGPLRHLYEDTSTIDISNMHTYIAYAQLPVDGDSHEGIVSETKYEAVSEIYISGRVIAGIDTAAKYDAQKKAQGDIGSKLQHNESADSDAESKDSV